MVKQIQDRNSQAVTSHSPLVLDLIKAGEIPLPQVEYGTQQQIANSKRKRHSERRYEHDEQQEEERLVSLIFGSTTTTASSSSTKLTKSFISDDRVKKSKRSYKPPKQVEDVLVEEDEELTFAIDRVGTAGVGFLADDDDDNRNDDVDKVGENEKQYSSKLAVAKKSDDVNDSDDGGDDLNYVDTPAWRDDDDDYIEVNLKGGSNRLRKLRKTHDETVIPGNELQDRLRQRFLTTAQLTARTDWAHLDPTNDNEVKDGDDDDDHDGDANDLDTGLVSFESTSEPLLLSSASGLKLRLPPHTIQMCRCQDANKSDPNQAVVQAVQFHPASDPEQPLLLTAGFDKTLRFFKVGTERSDKIHGIHFPKLPISSAFFLGNTGNVVVTGRRKFFYIYDAASCNVDLVPRLFGREERSLGPCAVSPNGKQIAFLGNDGYLLLVDVRSKHLTGTMKMNGSGKALSFSYNGERMVSSGTDGDIYQWDLRSRTCVERFANQDGTATSALACSEHHMAVGAMSGVVNLYHEESSCSATSASLLLSRRRLMIKSLFHMATSADALCFNPDGQILAMSTQREKNVLKLVHVPTATVFANWPTSKTPLGYVWSMDFSPQSRFLAMGNDKGKCLLYQLEHYHH